MNIPDKKIQININETSFFLGIGLHKFVNSLQRVLGETHIVKVETKLTSVNPLFVLKYLVQNRLVSNMIDIPDTMTFRRTFKDIMCFPNIHNFIDKISWKIVNVGSESARNYSIEKCVEMADKSYGFVKINMTLIEIEDLLKSKFSNDMVKFVQYFEDLGLRNHCDIKIGVEIYWNLNTQKEFLEKVANLRKFGNTKVTFGIDFDPIHHAQEIRKRTPDIWILDLEEELLDFYLIHERKILCIHLHDMNFGSSPEFDTTHLDKGELRNFYKRLLRMVNNEIPLVLELHPVIIIKMLVQKSKERMREFVENYL